MMHLNDNELETVLNALRIAHETLIGDAHQADKDNMPASAEAFRESARAYRELRDDLEGRAS